jgi:hypothetical protein
MIAVISAPIQHNTGGQGGAASGQKPGKLHQRGSNGGVSFFFSFFFLTKFGRKKRRLRRGLI